MEHYNSMFVLGVALFKRMNSVFLKTAVFQCTAFYIDNFEGKKTNLNVGTVERGRAFVSFTAFQQRTK